jgi:hypothetical protein
MLADEWDIDPEIAPPAPFSLEAGIDRDALCSNRDAMPGCNLVELFEYEYTFELPSRPPSGPTTSGDIHGTISR